MSFYNTGRPVAIDLWLLSAQREAFVGPIRHKGAKAELHEVLVNLGASAPLWQVRG